MSSRNKIDCVFSEVPVGTNFYAYMDADCPKSFDTIPCYKMSETEVDCREFGTLELDPNEPCFYYVED
ncbi:hypothetical protein EniLVp02_0181 [Vibrio phage EniLVp02]